MCPPLNFGRCFFPRALRCGGGTLEFFTEIDWGTGAFNRNRAHNQSTKTGRPLSQQITALETGISPVTIVAKFSSNILHNYCNGQNQ